MSTINKIVFETRVEDGLIYNPSFDWSLNASPANGVLLDWENRINQSEEFSFPRGVWIDNSANSNSVTITVLGTLQTIYVAPGDVFTAPLFCNKNPKIFVTNKNDGTPNLGQTQLIFASWKLDYVSVTNIIGSTGLDFSANAPAFPNVGANFSAAGPYANYVLVKTIAANPSRENVDIENTTGAQIVVIRDDGTAAVGAAPVNASMFPLAGGLSAGSQGGAWASKSFKGRLQIYAPAALAGNAYLCVMVD